MARSRRWTFGALLALLGCLGACGQNDDEVAATSSGGAPGCVPGAQVACACLGALQGVQICNDTGTAFGPCACPDAGAGGTAGSGGSGGGAGAAGAAGAAGQSPCPPAAGDDTCESCVKKSCCSVYLDCVSDTACLGCMNCLHTMAPNDCFLAGACDFGSQKVSGVVQCRTGICTSDC